MSPDPENPAIPETESLLPPEAIPEGGLQKFDKHALAAVSGSQFLPRLQLMTAASKIVKKKEFPENHFALIRGQKHQDLGESIDVAVLSWRPKAMDMSGDEVISIFDPKPDENDDPTGEFLRIVEKSKEQDSMCMWGSEYLVFIAAPHNALAHFFMGTISTRRESPKMHAKINQKATLTPEFCENKRFSWYAPEVSACSTPMELPNAAKLKSEIIKFQNPPEEERERVPEAGQEARVQ